MTPRERAEATWVKMTNPSLSYAEQIKVLREAFAEHVRALLADDDATIQAMARAMVDAYYIHGVGSPDDGYVVEADREAARAALAALRGKAFAQ